MINVQPDKQSLNIFCRMNNDFTRCLNLQVDLISNHESFFLSRKMFIDVGCVGMLKLSRWNIRAATLSDC